MQVLQANPPWADDLIKGSWPKILAFANKNKLPSPTSTLTARLKPHWNEYGCGAYGCVYPTTDPNVVMKIASDPNEIDFTLRSTTLRGAWLEGLTRFYAVLPIKGLRAKQEVVLIWRESAEHTGKLKDYAKKDEDLNRFSKRLMQTTHYGWTINIIVKDEYKYNPKFLQLVYGAMDIAGQATEKYSSKILDWKAKPVNPDPGTAGMEGDAMKVAMCACAYGLVAGALAAEPVSEYVGKTMMSLLDKQIVLGDIHYDNVGMVERHGSGVWVITDPGAQTVLDPKRKAMEYTSWIASKSTRLAANPGDDGFLESMAKYGPTSALVIMPPAIPSYLSYKAFMDRWKRKRAAAK